MTTGISTCSLFSLMSLEICVLSPLSPVWIFLEKEIAHSPSGPPCEQVTSLAELFSGKRLPLNTNPNKNNLKQKNAKKCKQKTKSKKKEKEKIRTKVHS